MTVIIEDHDEDTLCEIFDALKQNTTVETVCIESHWQQEIFGRLGKRATLSPASALLEHPNVNCLTIMRMETIEAFGAITRVFREKKNLSYLHLHSCPFTRKRMASLDRLLASDALDKFVVWQYYPAHTILHFPRGLAMSRHLKELAIDCESDYTGDQDIDENDEFWSVSCATLSSIAAMLKTNQVIQSLHLCFSATIPSNVLQEITQAVTGHESFTTLVLDSNGAQGADAGIALGAMLASNSVLKTLKLRFNNLGDA